MARTQSRVLRNHDDIRKWAEERNAKPACVRGTGDGDAGVLRLDFPGYSGGDSLEHIDWDEWFDKFEERGLALLVQDRTAGGERSNFNKIVSRETAAANERGSRRAGGSRARRTATGTRTPSRTPAKRSRSTAQKSRSSARGRSSKSSGPSTAKSGSRSGSRSTRRAGARKSSASTRGRSTARGKTASSGRMSKQSAAPSRRSKSQAARSSGSRTASRGRMSSKSHVLVDHDEIRRWAEERKAQSSCVRGTGSGDDPGMIRLDFPGFSGADSLEHIDWDEWFQAFDENNLALLVQDTTARGQRSNFNKLVSRENAMKSGGGKSRQRASRENPAPKKPVRGSTRAHRTESARGKNTSKRRAA